MTAQLVSQPACLPEAVERIRRQFDPVRIILFGSWARGNTIGHVLRPALREGKVLYERA
jgi:hypothetical protein